MKGPMSTQYTKPKFRNAYSKPVSQNLGPFEPSRTSQSEKDTCNINTIMKKYVKTGQLPDMIKNNPQYGDFSVSSDYQTAMNTVILANEQFAALSSSVRKRFNNNPIQFLEFVHDDANEAELVKMGLATARPSEPLKSSNSPAIDEPAAGKGPTKGGKAE